MPRKSMRSSIIGNSSPATIAYATPLSACLNTLLIQIRLLKIPSTSTSNTTDTMYERLRNTKLQQKEVASLLRNEKNEL